MAEVDISTAVDLTIAACMNYEDSCRHDNSSRYVKGAGKTTAAGITIIDMTTAALLQLQKN
jgi:hypothetical protein